MRKTKAPTAKSVKPRRKLGRPTRDFSAQNQILAGAATAFGAKGFADSSVEDVLEAAQVSRRTFYRFFKNKEELLFALFAHASETLMLALADAVASNHTPAGKLEAAVEAFLRVQAETGSLGRALLLEAMRPGSPLGPQYRRLIEEFTRMFQREGRLIEGRRIDPLLYRGLVAALEQIALTLSEGGGEVDLDRGKRVMLRLLIASLAAPGEAVPAIPRI